MHGTAFIREEKQTNPITTCSFIVIIIIIFPGSR